MLWFQTNLLFPSHLAKIVSAQRLIVDKVLRSPHHGILMIRVVTPTLQMEELRTRREQSTVSSTDSEVSGARIEFWLHLREVT